MVTFEKGRYYIEYDREGCIGAGTCTAAYRLNWVLDDSDGKANMKKKEIESQEELDGNIEAAKVCPVSVIKIMDKKTGKRIA
ncbi:MAG TPA: ferredoxin [Candidatus Nanoarchaeia archaeon]|nr:ferredoxin [Candidatus Nanoarchaeia archaeon]